MPFTKPSKIQTISDYHNFMGLPKPTHPQISVLRFEDITSRPDGNWSSIVNSFYCIALKRNFNAKMQYGQQEYDFDEGVLAFVAPNQVIRVTPNANEVPKHTGWLLLFHPDFLWHTSLANKINQYDFFGYQLNEALHLSEKEEIVLSDIIENIQQENSCSIDKFSQAVIIAQLELFLTYSARFYQRQFITRKKSHHTILQELENLLKEYFREDNLASKGLPTVEYISKNLNISPNYLSRLLTTLTGQSTKQFIHDKLIDFAKEKLSTTDLTVNEIAYKLGFEYPQSFNKLFKTKTNLTPIEFRNSFN
jgi:AraC-like DNA-binding protein